MSLFALRHARSLALVSLWLCACARQCDPPRDAVEHHREPAGTCAIEGFLRGDTPGRAFSATFAVYWTLLSPQHGTGARLVRASVADRRFRVAGLPCESQRQFMLSASTDDGRASALHSNLAGFSANLTGASGDRFNEIQLDMVRGLRFRGTVRDQRTGAALPGVLVRAEVQRGGRDGWARPQEFTVSDEHGAFRLDGVVLARLPDRAAAKITFDLDGYSRAEITVVTPAEGAVAAVDAQLQPLSNEVSRDP